MIPWEKFGMRTEYFNENYLTAVKRARIISVISAQHKTQSRAFVAPLDTISF